MKLFSVKSLLGITTAIGMFMGGMAMGTGSAMAQYSLSILHFNDFHARFEEINRFDSACSEKDSTAGKCFGGIARLKSKIDERRAALDKEGQANLLAVAGDGFQGSLFYTKYKGRATASLFNSLGIDAMAVGNHEFDDGPSGLADFIKRTNFTVLGGNVNVWGEPLLANKLPGYKIVDKGGQRIALIGIVTADTTDIASPGENVSFINNKKYLSAIIPDIQAQGVNKIVVISHVGLNEDVMLAESVPGIDVIIGGHSHTLLSNTDAKARVPYPEVVRGPDNNLVAIVQAYAFSKYLGEIKVDFDAKGNVTNASGEPILLDASVKPDEVMAARVAGLAAPLNAEKNIVVATTTTTIDGNRASCRAVECEMGNLVSDAMLARVKDQGVTIAIQNGGGLRASIDVGEITKGEVLTVLPFQNTLATFKLKGSDVVAALENGVSQVEDGKGRFPQVAGLRYAWDGSVAPLKGRIQQVQVMADGKWVDIDREKTYGVVSNNFMRAGGDGYSVFTKKGMEAYDFGPNLENVVIEFLQKNAPYKAYTDGRIVAGKSLDTMMAMSDGGGSEGAPLSEDAMNKDKMAKKDKMVKKAGDTMMMMEGDYMVKAGDNLWNIAKKQYGDGRMWRKIEKANKIDRVRGLKIGQMLKLPK